MRKVLSPFVDSAFSSSSASSIVTRAAMPCPLSNPISMRTRSVIRHQLREDAVDGLRMHERYLQAEESRPGFGVDELRADAREAVELGPEVRHLVRDVVHAGAALGQEAAHRRVLPRRLEQLDPTCADEDRRGLHAL